MRIRIALLSLVIAVSATVGVAAEAKKETFNGTVIAYDYFNNLIRMTFAPSRLTLLVRTKPHGPDAGRLIQVTYTYWSSQKQSNGGFPDDLVVSAKPWRFTLARNSGCEPIQEFARMEDAKTGTDTGDRLAIWKLLPGAEHEELPFGGRLPCYSLKAGDYKPYRN